MQNHRKKLNESKNIMEFLYPHYEWDIQGGFGYTQDDAVIIGESIRDYVGFEYYFIQRRTATECVALLDNQHKLANLSFKTLGQSLVRGDNGKSFDVINMLVRATPQIEFEKYGVDLCDFPSLYELQESGKVSIVEFKVVCWFDITYHLRLESGEEGVVAQFIP